MYLNPANLSPCRRPLLALCVGFGILGGAGVVRGQLVVGTFANPPQVIGGTPFVCMVQVAPSPTLSVHGIVYGHDVVAVPVGAMGFFVPPGTALYPVVWPTRPVAADTVVDYSVLQTYPYPNHLVSSQVTVLTPRVSDLTLDPASPLVGGTSVTATVTLTGPAPENGAMVDLWSSDLDIIEMPDLVVVSPGETQASFPIIVHPVLSAKQVGLHAHRAGDAHVTGVVVNSPSVELLAARAAGVGGAPEPRVSIVGGTPVEVYVTLDGHAPEGGTTIRLQSTYPAGFPVETFMKVPPGTRMLTFVVETQPVASDILVTYSAQVQGQTPVEAQAKMYAPDLDEVTITPDQVIGGQSTSGTVHLNGAAPAGGVVVDLAASASSVTVPADVTVPTGETRGLFEILTARVAVPLSVEIQASLASTTEAAEFTVAPARLGDVDGDGDIELDDYEAYAECMDGPGVMPSGLFCPLVFGFDLDPYTDLADFAGFQNTFTGPRTGVPRIHTVVDDSVSPPLDDLLPLEGTGPRPLAGVLDETGIQANFIADELMVVTDSPAELAGFLSRWEGTVLRELTLPGDRGANSVFSLVRINTALADVESLPEMLAAITPEAGETAAILQISSETGAGLLAAAAEETLAGSVVSVNWIPMPQGYQERDTAEAPPEPGDPDDYTPNAYCWDYMAAGGDLDIGVTEAWRYLDALGLLVERSIPIGILDGGFQTSVASPNPDFPPPIVLPDPSADPYALVNPMDCGGSACAYHGTSVLSTLMSIPDNGIGSAGVAGPVGQPVLFVSPGNYSDFQDYYTMIATMLDQIGSTNIRIYNFSGSIHLHWTLGGLVNAIYAVLDVFNVISEDILIFAAAGNDGIDIDAENRLGLETHLTVPCELDDVLCVGGLGPSTITGALSRDPNSNFGNEDVDIWAPYHVWVGPDPNTPVVHEVGGTSLASPYAAGVAALIWAADPSLSSSAVWSIMRNTAHDSWFSVVNRYVNAYGAVAEILPGTPPDICITSPDDGSGCGLHVNCPDGLVGPMTRRGRIQGGMAVRFRAEVEDRDQDPETLLIEWTSDQELGPIGFGREFWANDLDYGTHTIRATVVDALGLEAYDEVEVTITNDPPHVEIMSPLDGWEFCLGEVIDFRGLSFDVNRLGVPLPNGDLTWTSNREGLLGTGDSLARPLLVAGTHTITFRGEDDAGEVDTDSISVEVLPLPCDTIAVVLITEPPADVEIGDPDYVYDGYSATHGMWYKDVQLAGMALDIEDGPLTGASLHWTTNRTDLAPHASGTLGYGESITVRLYSDDTAGTWHQVILTATDSAGNEKSYVRWIFIWQLI